MKIEKKNRIAWVDRARSVAVLCVILCHATERSFFFAGKDILEQPIVMQTLGFFLFTIGRLGVPIFLFISGFLLLQRTYEGEMSFRFWRHNFLPLLGVTECWIIIYNLFLIWYEQRQISLVGLVKNMLFLENVGLPHFWYLPMILGIYLVLPLLSVALNHLNNKAVLLPFILIAIYSFGCSTLNVFLNAKGVTALNNPLSTNFGQGVFVCYLICGYLVYKKVFDGIKKNHLIILMIFLLGATTLMQVWLSRTGYRYYVWYDSLPLGLLALCLFLFMYKEDKGMGDGRSLSISSFGIYLIHIPIMEVINRYLSLEVFTGFVRTVILFVATLILSWGTVKIVSKNPKLGKFLFLIK